MPGRLIRLFGGLFGKRDGGEEPEPSTEDPAQRNGARDGEVEVVEMVWTPKGFRPRNRAHSEDGRGRQPVEIPGRAAYGGTDTSPPRGGYGVGRTYD